MEQPLFTTKELAYRWQLAVITLERWRRQGTGPEYFKKGRNIFYNRQDIEKYEQSRKFQSTAEYPPELKRKNPKEIRDTQ